MANENVKADALEVQTIAADDTLIGVRAGKFVRLYSNLAEIGEQATVSAQLAQSAKEEAEAARVAAESAQTTAEAIGAQAASDAAAAASSAGTASAAADAANSGAALAAGAQAAAETAQAAAELALAGLTFSTQFIASAATITPLATNDKIIVTNLAVDTVIANPTGVPVEGNGFVLAMRSPGAARFITSWGDKYRASGDSLPENLVADKWLHIPVQYESTDDMWTVFPASQEI